MYADAISSVPNFILAFIPAEINSDTLNTMTAFAVCVVPLTPLDTINSRMALSRLVVSFPTFSCTSFHTRSWVNIKVLEFDLWWLKTRETSLLGNFNLCNSVNLNKLTLLGIDLVFSSDLLLSSLWRRRLESSVEVKRATLIHTLTHIRSLQQLRLQVLSTFSRRTVSASGALILTLLWHLQQSRKYHQWAVLLNYRLIWIYLEISYIICEFLPTVTSALVLTYLGLRFSTDGLAWVYSLFTRQLHVVDGYNFVFEQPLQTFLTWKWNEQNGCIFLCLTCYRCYYNSCMLCSWDPSWNCRLLYPR